MNFDKSKVVHFRNNCVRQTEFEFNVGNSKLEIVPSYKYLGVIFDAHLNFKECSQALSDAGVRALHFKALPIFFKNMLLIIFISLVNLNL